MRTVPQLKFLIYLYVGILVFLLVSVMATPLVIRNGWQVSHDFLIDEGILETSLIVVLFGISCLILIGARLSLRAYDWAVKQAGEERSRLISRLAESFSYLGTVNVELQQVHSILCGMDRYPQTKREWKRLFEDLATKVMTVAGTPWTLVRILNRCDFRTVKEFVATRPKTAIPDLTVGNREILEDRPVPGWIQIGSCPANVKLKTVCILPKTNLSEEENILIQGIVNQIELLYMLHLSDAINQNRFLEPDDNGRSEEIDIS
jgi:hypothetical protein